MSNEFGGATPTSVTSDLVARARSVSNDVSKLSYVEAGFLFRSFLDDYVLAVETLVEILGSSVSVRSEEISPICRRLCQLSRDLLYSITPDLLPSEYCLRLQALFRATADVIPMLNDVELLEYRDHIAGRVVRRTSYDPAQERPSKLFPK